MQKIICAASGLILLFMANACSKNDNNPNTPPAPPDKTAKTVANLSGTYTFTASTASALGQTFNIYDSLPACQQDNEIELDTTLVAKFIDAGTVCTPPTDSTGTWSLSSDADTIYVAGGASAIKSWDGSKLVLTTNLVYSGVPVTATSTFVKK